MQRRGQLGEQGGSGDFAGMFTKLLQAAHLKAPKLARELERQGQPVQRSTIYDWSGGQHLPGNDAVFRAVVRICLQRAHQHGAEPPLPDEAAWMALLQDARQSRDSNATTSPIKSERYHDSPMRAGDWTPAALGVQKAIGGNELPSFVRRQHDDLLDAALNPDVEASRLIVLRGGPSTGKSRSAYNAVCQGRLAAWRLEYPSIPAELTRLLEGRVSPRTVIWLRELRDYADAEGGQEALARLARVLAGSRRIIVITTTWKNFWNAYSRDHRGDPGSRDPYPAVRALLAGLPELTSTTDLNNNRGGMIEVPDEFGESELASARQLTDPALAEAITTARREGKPGRVIQYLAAVPDLLHKYEGPGVNPYTQAVITTAMDVARITGLTKCTPAFLCRAAIGHLSDEHRVGAADDWCEAAISDAAVELRGAVRALTPIPEKDSTQVWSYKLADYLDQYGRKIFAEKIPPPQFWAAALHSKPNVQGWFGEAAADRGLLRIGAQLLKNGTKAVPGAATDLVRLMHRLDPSDTRAAAWAVAQIDLAHPHHVARLLNALREAGADWQATALLERDPAGHVDTGDLAGVSYLLEALYEAEAGTQIAAILASNLTANADAIDVDTIGLLHALHKVGAKAQLIDLAERAAASADPTDPDWMASLLSTFHEIGATDQINGLLARDPAAHIDVADSLEFISYLIDALNQVGADTQLTPLAERAVASADPDDIFTVSELLISLHAAGKDALIRTILRTDPARRVDVTKPHLVATLLEALIAISADAEVATLLSRNPAIYADLTYAPATAYLFQQFEKAGAEGQVAALLARDPIVEADQSDPVDFLEFFPVLEAMGAEAQITALIDRLPGAGYFGIFLGYSKFAERYHFGREHNGRPAAPWCWDDLE